MPANLWLFILKKKVIKPIRHSMYRGWEGVYLHISGLDAWWSGETCPKWEVWLFGLFSFSEEISVFLKGHSPGCQYSGRGWEERYIISALAAAWCTSLSNVSPAGVVITCLQGVEWGPEDLTTANAHIHSAPCFSSLLQLWNPWASQQHLPLMVYGISKTQGMLRVYRVIELFLYWPLHSV